jgi:transcriptional regulator with XRE-family HTH domain
MSKPQHPLRAWRKENGKTLTALAGDERVGVTPSHLSQIETGIKEPSLDLAARLHRVTGIDMTKFLKAREAAA